jgi:hypothetical protein
MTSALDGGVLNVNYINQTQIHKTEQLATQPSASELVMSVEKLKGHITRY